MPKNKGNLGLLTPSQLVKSTQKPQKIIDKNKKKKAAPPQRQRLTRGCKQERFEAKAILPCAVKTLIKGRPDEATIKAHLKAIMKHSKKYQYRIESAKAASAKGNVADMHAIPAHKAKVTEAIGERETTMWCLQNLPGYEIRSGFAAGIGIDQIWAQRDSSDNITHYAVVEAKGPGAKLSDNAAKGDQMSTQWVKASLEQALVSSKTTDQEKIDARAMLHAIANGPPPEVRGYVIEAKPEGGAVQRGCPDKGIYHLVT
jgi:hypothetical protein